MIEPINLKGIVPEAVLNSLDERAIRAVLRNVAEGARAEWIRLAGKRLKSSAPDYLMGIQKPAYTRNTATISLVGARPNQIEQGHPRIEQKDTLLGSRVPVTKPPTKGKRQRYKGRGKNRREDGFYRAIPFRHATPGSRGQVGTPMGDAYRGKLGAKAAENLGKAVYKAARDQLKGDPSVTDPYGAKTKWGGRLNTSDLVYKRKRVNVPKLRSYHTTDIYSGMVRLEKTYEKATQGQFKTFRMISVNASGRLVGAGGKPKDPRSWVIPAKKGIHLAEEVNAYVEKQAAAAFTAFLESLK